MIFLKVIKKILAYFLILLQSFPFYRRLLRKIFHSRFEYRQVSTIEDEKRFFNFYNPKKNIEQVDIKLLTGKQDYYKFMALYKGRIIGAFSLIKKEDKKNYPGWWVYSLEISLPFRGVGVGNGLMQEAINFSREKKAPFIYLSVWDKLKPARKLYKKIGLREFGRETVKIPHEKNIRTHLLMKKELY